MNYEVARSFVGRMKQENLGAGASVGVPLTTGSHHTIAVFRREPGGEYGKGYSGKHPSGARAVELDTRVGDIVYQRVTSPASAETLERYGVVVGDRRIDWGSDADWVVDFGPMGDVTRRGLSSAASSFRRNRERTLSPSGEEAVGGATESAGGTSHGSG